MISLSSRSSRGSLTRLCHFLPNASNVDLSHSTAAAVRSLATIAEGVGFDTVAREWRCKWSVEQDKASLVAAQKAFDLVRNQLAQVDGVRKVDRVVCGGCKDYKIITSMPAGAKYDAWAAANFQPEEAFLNTLKDIPGISKVETQTYTIMPMYP